MRSVPAGATALAPNSGALVCLTPAYSALAGS